MSRLRSERLIQRFTLLIGCMVLLATTAFATDNDEKTGNIKGKVTTTDGKAAADVAIVIRETRETGISDADGSFVFRGLQPGSYHLEVTLAGYTPQMQEVTVEAGKSATVALQLSISRKELQEVVITGNTNRLKRSSSDYVAKLPLKNLENPQVYTTITKDLLNEQVVFTVDDALRNAPGLTKMWDATGRSGDGGSYYNARGFIVQSYLRNGVAGTVSAKTDAANLERIEVIKGPSATLFGNVLTSYGGLINRITKKPYTKFGGEISMAAGSFGFHRIGVDINTPLDDEENVLLRTNAAYSYEGSFQDNGFNRGFVIAPSLTYKVNDKLSFQMDAEFHTGQTTGLRVFFFPYGQTIASLGVYRADELNIDYKRSYVSDDLYQVSRSTNFFGQMNYKLSDKWLSQTNITITNSFSDGPSPYFYLLSDGAVTGNPNDIGNRYISRNDQYTDNSKDQMVEVQQNFIGDFHIGSLRNRFVGGLDFFYRNSDQFFAGNTLDTIDVTADVIPNYRDFNRTNMDRVYQTKGNAFIYPSIFTTNTYSAYVSDVLNLMDNLMVLAALRLDHFVNNGAFDATTGKTGEGYKQTALSPKFGIVYQPIKDRISIFGNYQNGFTNKDGVDSTGERFKPEQANQLEGGVKLDVFDGKLSATFSYYHIEVSDVLRPIANTPYSVQDGTQVSKGFEAELLANPVKGLNILAGFSYNDSKYEKAAKEVEGLRPGTASSPVAANLWISYRLTQGAAKGLGLGFGGNYASDNKIINDRIVGTFTLPAYTVLNASLFYDHPKFRLSVKMDNITNERYWIGYTTVNPQKLRSFTGSIAFRF